MQFPIFTGLKNYLWPTVDKGDKEKKDTNLSNSINEQKDISKIANQVITEGNQVNLNDPTINKTSEQNQETTKEFKIYVKKEEENEISLADFPPEILPMILGHLPHDLPYDKALARVCKFFKVQLPVAQKINQGAIADTAALDDNAKANRNIETLKALLPRVISKPEIFKKYNKIEEHLSHIKCFNSFEDAKKYVGAERWPYVIITGDEQEDESNEDIVVPEAGRFFSQISLFFDKNDILIWATSTLEETKENSPSEECYATSYICDVEVEFRNSNEMSVQSISFRTGALGFTSHPVQELMNKETQWLGLKKKPIIFKGLD